MKKSLTILIPGLLMITALTLLLWLYAKHSVGELAEQTDDKASYDSHYMLISEDRSDQWRSIFAAAKRAAQDEGATVEWVGENLPAEYTLEDCMRIATASRCDGIILHLGGDDMTDLIDAAADQGIPVITVLEDDPDSKRVSYIGLNGYQMGEIYGTQILRALQDGDNDILVLQNTGLDNPTAALMYSQMVQTVEQSRAPGQRVNFSALEINTMTSFDAEEDIRDIFLRGEQLPNILICLDLISTECVCQALVDYNEVGNVTVIGYYASEKVIDGLKKGLIDATLSLDSEEIGRLCISALEEVRQLGHVSNYFNVGLTMLTASDVMNTAGLEYSAESSLEAGEGN